MPENIQNNNIFINIIEKIYLYIIVFYVGFITLGKIGINNKIVNDLDNVINNNRCLVK